MKSSKVLSLLAATLLSLTPTSTAVPTWGPGPSSSYNGSKTQITPKFFIVSMFTPEAEVWYGIPEFDILAQNITVFGLSPLFPEIHCTADGEICQVVTGEGEINAAATITALAVSPRFNLTKTYFMVAGIAGVNPEVATTASVTFAKYAVQVALQQEFDAREIPANFSTGYVPQGATSPDEYPQNIYGTEVFEVSEALQQLAIGFASKATLNDTTTAQEWRTRYANSELYRAGAAGPTVLACDVATSDVYFSGTLLAQAFGRTSSLFTNGSATYCTTAQEDNATLEALLRSSRANLTDFRRVIVMRTASDFDRPPPTGESAIDNLFSSDLQGGFPPAITNIYRAGVQVVLGVLAAWNETFAAGVDPGNYIGDIFDSLGGVPDFGLPSEFIARRGVTVGNARMRSRRFATA